MESDVPVDILAFEVLRRATFVWIPRANGEFRAQEECIGNVICRHGRLYWLLLFDGRQCLCEIVDFLLLKFSIWEEAFLSHIMY